ncbi:MAG: guanylate kinase [Alphaproteobacteria bacterium]|nr:guanylate kinase [Alphaproteobacteria bacterium]
MQNSITRRGLLLVLSSPSGAGKTTIARALLSQDQSLALSVSVTTRPMRRGEVDGTDYYFKTQDEFQELLNQNAFLEYAQVFSNFYGTPKKEVEQIISRGKDVLFDIDWQGTQQLQEKCPQDLVTIFILPPSIDILEQRLRRRATDSEAVVKQRMDEALNQISHWAEYDYVIVNDDLNHSIKQINLILQAERQKRHRQIGLVQFVNTIRKA